MQTEFAEAALRYARLGLQVVPLRPRDKKPILDNWTQAATSDVAMISRWWAQAPDSNVGIVTGPKSQVFVFDVDVKSGGQDSFDACLNKHGRFPETWQQITGSGGFHLFFRYPAFRIANAAGLFPGIDIRGDGGQVVAPPSIHPNGNRYEWDGLEEIEKSPLAEAPIWLLEMLEAKNSLRHSDSLPVAEKIPHGVQHHTLLSLAGMMRRLGLTDAEMLPTLHAVNLARCEKPGPEKNIVQIAKSVMKYRPADKALTRVANTVWRMAREGEEKREKEEQKLGVEVVDALTVFRRPAAETKCVVDGVLYNGLTLFAGRPKSGKSWLVLQVAKAVAQGQRLFGRLDTLRPGGVLYLALEEGQSRTSGRLHKLDPNEDIMLQNISMVYSLSPLLADGKAQLEKLLRDRRPNLVIIDTLLALVGSAGQQKRDVMRGEYSEMKILGDMAREYDTAILLVHHTRKHAPGESAIDSVAGSTGVTAAADCIWTIKREDQHAATLEVVGREMEEQALGLKFIGGDQIRWELTGIGDQVKTAKCEKEIVELIRNEGAHKGVKIATLLRLNANDVRAACYSLSQRGILRYQSNGTYVMDAVTPPWEGGGE